MTDKWEVYQKDDFTKVFLTINTFRDVEYLHLREYYLSFEEEWLPGKGISVPLTIISSLNLLSAIKEIVSIKEAEDSLNEQRTGDGVSEES